MQKICRNVVSSKLFFRAHFSKPQRLSSHYSGMASDAAFLGSLDDADGVGGLNDDLSSSTPACLWLEESSRERAWSSLLSPGLALHADALGAGLAPRPEVRHVLRQHVASLGPPHTLVLTGCEGSGKTTELAVLAQGLRRGDGDGEGDGGNDRFREDDEDAGVHDSSSDPPFILAHSFANGASFSTDVNHFLEKACVQLKHAFGIKDQLPTDPNELPKTFADFLETAVLYRRVVVLIDACESCRVAPYASVVSTTIAGLDPREHEPISTGVSSDENDSSKDNSSFIGVSDPRAHFKWLPQSPPLAVRFVLTVREDTEVIGDSLLLSGAIASRAPASVFIYPMPPMSVEETRAVLSSATPAELGNPESTSNSSLDRGHHHSLEIAAVMNAVTPHGATPLYARVAAPFVTGIVSATKHGAWVKAGGFEGEFGDEEAEFGGGHPGDDTSNNPNSIDTIEVPQKIAAAILKSPGTAFGLVSGRLGGFEQKADIDHRVLRAACLCLAVTRFGVTIGELKLLTKHLLDRETQRKREWELHDGSKTQSETKSPFTDALFEAALDAVTPWLSPWTDSRSWANEKASFKAEEGEGDAVGDSDDDDARFADRARSLEQSADPVLFAFRDASIRAAVLKRYAPVHAVSSLDRQSVRARVHHDIASFFFSRTCYRPTRRDVRSAIWHAGASGDASLLSKLVSAKGYIAFACVPGARSELACVLTNGVGGQNVPEETHLVLASVVEQALRTWMDSSESDEHEERAHELSTEEIRKKTKERAERSGTHAGASLALASLFIWLHVPTFAVIVLEKAQTVFGTARGRSGVTCALALALSDAKLQVLAKEISAGDGSRESGQKDLLKLINDTQLACNTFASVSSGDYSGVFPSPWRSVLESSSEFGNALRSPPILPAIAASLRVKAGRMSDGIRKQSDTNRKQSETTHRTTDALRVAEIDAWRRAVLTTATPRMSKVIADVLGGSTGGTDVTDVTAKALRYSEDFSSDTNAETIRSERWNVPSAEVFQLLNAIRRRRDATDAVLYPESSRDAADIYVSVSAAVLGNDHPAVGAAKVIAAEAAIGAVVDGGHGGFDNDDTDSFELQIETLIAWSRPAYEFAERFYGPKSLPAARAAWCVAEGVRRRGDGLGGNGFSVSGGAGARHARPMYAQALGAAAATLGLDHPGVGATMIAAGTLSRMELRLEEASALVTEGTNICAAHLRKMEYECAEIIEAGVQKSDAMMRDNHNSHRFPQTVVEQVNLATSVAMSAAESRVNLAQKHAALAYAKLALLKRDGGDLLECEALTLKSLTMFELASGPACASAAPMLAALGRCSFSRQHLETTEACFRHAMGVDELAARSGGLWTGDQNGSSYREHNSSRCSFRHPRSASHLVSIAFSKLTQKNVTQVEVLLHAALEAHESVSRNSSDSDCLHIEPDDQDDGQAKTYQKNADPVEILNRLGLLYRHQGRFTEAAVRYERAISIGAARMRVAERDAEQAKRGSTDDTDITNVDTPNAPPKKYTNRTNRRVRVVAASRAAKRWRDASEIVAVILCNLGGLRFGLGMIGQASSCFHKATQFIGNNPDLGETHPLNAFAFKWLECCGGLASVSSTAGVAAASMLDNVFKDKWSAYQIKSSISNSVAQTVFKRDFETAWGALAGEEGGVNSMRENDETDNTSKINGTPRKVPVVSEIGAFSERKGMSNYPNDASLRYDYGAVNERNSSVTRDTAAHLNRPRGVTLIPASNQTPRLSLDFDGVKNYASKKLPPATHVALAQFRQADTAVKVWRDFFIHSDAEYAWHVDFLEVDLTLANVIDDVANSAVGKHSEKVFVQLSVEEIKKKEIVDKRYVRAVRSTRDAAADASSFLHSDWIWASRCDGGFGKTLDETLGSDDLLTQETRDDVEAVEGVRLISGDDFKIGDDLPLVDPTAVHDQDKTYTETMFDEVEAEKAENPENEFLEHYRTQLAKRLMKKQEDEQWQKTKLEAENSSSRKTMSAIVRDGDLVGTEGDESRQLDLSASVTSFAGTKSSLDAAKGFFVDSSLEGVLGLHNGASIREPQDPDGKLQEPVMWAPGEYERAAERRLELNQQARDAAQNRDIVKRDMLALQQESLDRCNSGLINVTRQSVMRQSAESEPAAAALAAVEAAAQAVRIASAVARAYGVNGDALARAGAVSQATAAARASMQAMRPARPSTASKLLAFRKRQESKAGLEFTNLAASLPLSASRNRNRGEESRDDERDETYELFDTRSQLRTFDENHDTVRFVNDENDEHVSPVRKPTSSRARHTVKPTVVDGAVSIPVERLLSWLDRGFGNGEKKGLVRDSMINEASDDGSDDVSDDSCSKAPPLSFSKSPVRPALKSRNTGRLDKSVEVRISHATPPRASNSRFYRMSKQSVHRSRDASTLGTQLHEERAFRTHNASARLLNDLNSVRGARRLRESVDAGFSSTGNIEKKISRRPASAKATTSESITHRPTLVSRRPSSAAGFANDEEDDEWKAKMRKRVEERRRKLFGVDKK